MDLISPIVDDTKIIVQIDSKNALIATGINFSLSNENSISILGKEFTLESEYLGFSLLDINKVLKTKVDYVIGSNILSKFNYCINNKKKEFKFSTDTMLLEGTIIPIFFELDIPNIEVIVNGKKIHTLIDSLSNFCYLHDKNVKDSPETSTESDFMIGMGNFNAKTYDITYLIDTLEENFKTGVYPPVISKSRRLTESKGVIGSQFLHKYIVTVNSTDKKLSCKKI